jgi:hypothetical protein
MAQSHAACLVGAVFRSLAYIQRFGSLRKGRDGTRYDEQQVLDWVRSQMYHVVYSLFSPFDLEQLYLKGADLMTGGDELFDKLLPLLVYLFPIFLEQFNVVIFTAIVDF